MRTLTGGETAVLAGNHQSVHWRVFIENGSGTLKNMSTLGGRNWQIGFRRQLDIDQFSARLTLTLRRDHGTDSIAPLREDSVLNRLDDNTTYAPLIDPNRLVVLEQATLAVGATPSSGDWREIFRGHVGEVDSGTSNIKLECYDFGRRMVRRQIMHGNDQPGQEPIFGTGTMDENGEWEIGTGQPLEDAIQEVLDYAFQPFFPDIPQLYTPVSPNYEVFKWRQPMESVADTIQRLAGSIGWVIRYKYDEGTSTWRLTLFDPEREKTTPDFTLAADRYFPWQRLALDDEPVRNWIRVYYTDSVTRARTFKLVFDTASALRFDVQEMAVGENEDSPITTEASAEILGNAILSDLKDPKAEVVVPMPFFWPAELGDLDRFTANGVHSDVDQDWAVTGIIDEVGPGLARTQLMVRGKPAGAFYGWFRIRGPVDRPVPAVPNRSTAPLIEVVFTVQGHAKVKLRSVLWTHSFKFAYEKNGSIPSDAATLTAPTYNAVNGEASFTIGGGTPVVFNNGDTLSMKAASFPLLDGLGMPSDFSTLEVTRGIHTLRLSPQDIFPHLESGAATVENGVLRPTTGTANFLLPHDALFPVDSRIKRIRFLARRETVSDVVKITGRQSTQAPPAEGPYGEPVPDTHAIFLELEHATTGWDLVESAELNLATTETSGGVTTLHLQLFGDANPEDARLVWLEFDYNTPADVPGGGTVYFSETHIGDIIGMDGSGTTGKLAKFVGGQEVGDSIISESGSTATVGGTLAATTLTGAGSGITALNASELGSGTVPDARFPATLPAASGANLTALNASQVTSGTLPLARLVDIADAQIAAAAAVAWSKISKAGSSLADLATRSASDLNSGTLPLARLVDIANAQISASAAIAWTKLSKAGSSLADLATRAHSDLQFSGLTSGHVWRSTGASAASFGTLASGAFADNTVAPSRLTNISQSQLIGRTASGSGAASAVSSTRQLAGGRWHDVTAYAGASGLARLNAAISAIGSAADTLNVDENVTLTGTLTVPANVTLRAGGGLITTTGQTLNVNGKLDAGLRQIFTGTGAVVFGPGSANQILPQWWGAKADGTTNDTAAIQAAINACLASKGGTVYLPGGVYSVTGLTIAGNNIALVGTGSGYSYASLFDGHAVLKARSGAASVLLDLATAGFPNDANGCLIQDISIDCNLLSSYGIKVSMANRIDGVRVKSALSAGILLDNFTNSTHVTNSSFSANFNWGIHIRGASTTIYSISDTNVASNNAGGILIEAGQVVSFARCVIESNTGPGIRIYRPNSHAGSFGNFTFDQVWVEDNGSVGDKFSLVIDAETQNEYQAPSTIRFRNSRISCAGDNTRKYMNIACANWVTFEEFQLNGTTNVNAITIGAQARMTAFLESTRVEPYPDPYNVYNGPTLEQAFKAMESGVRTYFSQRDVRHLVGDLGHDFAGAWSNYDSAYAPAAYWHDRDGEVRLQGVVAGTTAGTTIFFLPAGFRPPKYMQFVVETDTGPGRVLIEPSTGAVSFQYGDPAAVSLEGICFTPG